MISLRDYQIKQITEIRSEMAKGHKRIIMQAATGAGKTVMFSYMIKKANERGKHCMILTDRIELLTQAGGTFEKVGINYSVITKETRHVPSNRVLICMVETVKRRVKARMDFTVLLKQVDLLIIDEAHKASFNAIFNYIKPECFVIGATATPIRQNGEPLSKFFSVIVQGTPISQLISEGYLAKPNYFGVPIDLSGVHIKAGEYDEHDLTDLYSETKIFSGLTHNLEKHAKGLKTLIFCPSIAVSLKVADELKCLHVDGEMNKDLRRAIFKKFESDPQGIMTNVGIATTGYDHPQIECGVLYRATRSLPLYLQMVGRISRIAPGKKSFKILDFGMNVERFGWWHLEREWSLNPPKKKNGKKEDVFPVKFCPKCGAILAMICKACEYCGYIYPVKEEERIFAELQEMEYGELVKKVQGMSVKDIEQVRVAKGYKVGWLLRQLKSEQDFKDYAKLKGYHYKWVDHQAERYLVKSFEL
jgi:superfamily II DNA or RNA helicase